MFMSEWSGLPLPERFGSADRLLHVIGISPEFPVNEPEYEGIPKVSFGTDQPHTDRKLQSIILNPVRNHSKMNNQRE